MNSLRSCSFAQPSLHCLTKKACSGLREFSLNVTVLDWKWQVELKHHIDAKYYQNPELGNTFDRSCSNQTSSGCITLYRGLRDVELGLAWF